MNFLPLFSLSERSRSNLQILHFTQLFWGFFAQLVEKKHFYIFLVCDVGKGLLIRSTFVL